MPATTPPAAWLDPPPPLLLLDDCIGDVFEDLSKKEKGNSIYTLTMGFG